MRSLNDETLITDTWIISGVADGDIDYKKLREILEEKIDEISDFDTYIENSEFADLMDTFLYLILAAFDKFVSPKKREATLYCDYVASSDRYMTYES